MSSRIGFDATPLVGHRSGVGHYTGRLISAIMTEQPEWDCLMYSNKPLGKLESSLRSGIQTEQYFNASRWLWMQTHLPGIIRHTEPDLCHFPNALAPVLQPRPFVLTIHDASLFLYQQYHPWRRHLAIRVLLPIIARRSNAIITVSQQAKQDLIRTLHVNPDKIHVVYEAPPDDFKPIHNAAKLTALHRQYGLPNKFVLHVGTLEPRKNLFRLVDALQMVHRRGTKAHLVLVGPTGWGMDGFQAHIDELGLHDFVHQIGYVPTADLPGLYSLATALAFPSLYEGFGLPPLEAMICETAVLTSLGTSMAEVCGAAAHLVDPHSVDDIANGLQLLLHDSTYRHELVRRGKQHVQKFSWRQAARETIAVYKQVLA